MKQLLLLFTVLASLSANAQKIRFTDTTNQWTLLSLTADLTSGTIDVRFGKDTMLAGYSYRTLNSIAIREDTADHRLYFRGIYFPADTAEHVLFDYNLQVNDTFTLAVGNRYSKHIVHSIDSVQIGNNHYKTWDMRATRSNPPSGYGAKDYIFIEGLGTNYGPAFSTYPFIFEGCEQLRCFSNQGVVSKCIPHVSLPCSSWYIRGPQPVSWFDNEASCSFTLAVANVAGKTSVPVLYPNPGGPQTVLKVPAHITKRPCL